MFPEVFFMILISPDSVRTKGQALFVHQRWPASVYVLPEINSGRSQGFSAIPMKADGKWGLNVVVSLPVFAFNHLRSDTVELAITVLAEGTSGSLSRCS